MVNSNPLTQTTLTPKAQLLTLALAALIAPASTAFCTGGTVLFGTDYLNNTDALLIPMRHAGNASNTGHFGGLTGLTHLQQ